MWDLATGKLLWTSDATGLNACPPAFSPNGMLLAGCIDSKFYVWDAATGKSSLFPPAGTEAGKGVTWRSAASFDGLAPRLLLLAWAGDTAELWDWQERSKVAGYREPPELNRATISPDGHWLATTNDAGEIRLWNLSLDDPQALLGSAKVGITRTLAQ
jgi:WD40 repeat protein